MFFLSYTISNGYWKGLAFVIPGMQDSEYHNILSKLLLVLVIVAFGLVHFLIRGAMAKWYARGLAEEGYYGNLRSRLP